ncbi:MULTISPECIES: MerR family transcriptional regulator [unclassified Chelatococcus]|uniref:MerR family transcriptional regulator n=1 Tax=unclassified Chelatococcus TaxID=2638111 RepID=UPI00224BCE22|nr:MerR family transcriptional regulator [Chelatococcus sp.]MCO5076999.1 MerR family transcriptional regulator [Chelatococcus sp.]CAH1671509.1 MerR-like DNA binding protein [Hyphomicrobiales bacterium]CAH1676278.1 MerR-like DNA binding protein [Hyphomicrobiales bacterium]
MDKGPDAFRTISEVGEELDVPQHVLRFWETRFTQIKPLKRGGGRRYYRPDDVELLRGIRHLLYGEGYTIKGVQRILKQEGVRFVQQVWQEPHQLSSINAGQRFADDFDEADTNDGRGHATAATGEMRPAGGPEQHAHHGEQQSLEAVWQQTPTMPVVDADLREPVAQAGPRTYQLRNHEALHGPDMARSARNVDVDSLDSADERLEPDDAFAALGHSGLDETSATRLSMVLDELRECRRLIAIARGAVDDDN